MRSTSPVALAFALSLAGALVTAAPRASAESGIAPTPTSTCAQDSDCGHGFTCQVTAVSGCTAPACAPDQICDASAPPDCTPGEERACRPGPCAGDADCASTMACVTVDDSVCTSPAPKACPSGQKCPTPPTTCTHATKSVCEYRWQLPCQADADCGGAQFTCVASTVCSGGGSAGGNTDASTPTSEATWSECHPTDTKYCQVPSLPCDNASACPNGWSCVPSAMPGLCPRSVDADASCGGPVAQVSYCEPPGYGEAHSGKDGSALSDAPDASRAAPTVVSGDAGPSSAGVTTGSVDAGESASGNGATGTGNGASTGNTPSSNGTPDEGGCSVGASASVGEGAWMVMLGAAEMLRRLARQKR